MDVSVIIPTFNRRELVQRALRSVFDQTLPPREIIVVDDGSTDDTEQAVRRRFPCTRLLKQEHWGVSRARNLGIEQAQGEWLAFLDSDDEWAPSKLERQCEELKASLRFHVCHTDEIWIRYDRRVNPMKKHAKRGGQIFRHCLRCCVISPSSIMIHRSVIEKVGDFDENLPVCEDYDLWLRVCANYPVLFIPENLVIKHGGHRDQLSRRYWGMDRFRIQALEKIISTQTLNEMDREAAIRMLWEKIDVVLQGAIKRRNNVLIRQYRKKQTRSRALLKDKGSDDDIDFSEVQ